MRRGFSPRIYFENGHLVAVSTGSDACAEHECGSKELLTELCEQYANEAKIIEQLKRGECVKYPELLETKRIVRRSPHLKFSVNSEQSVPEAILSLCPSGIQYFLKTELMFSPIGTRDDPDVAGAWDASSFALRVRGERYVNALSEFYKDLRNKQVVFGGLFFKRDSDIFSGVILVNSRYLSAQDLENIEKAQRKYESTLRLKARDDSTLVSREVNEALKNRFGFGGAGYIWARWKDEHESEVVYGLNPWSHKQAEYFGPYTREELLAWAHAQASYKLVPKAALA